MITQNQRTNQRASAKASLLQQYWRGIQDKHCRGIQDTLNIKGKVCLDSTTFLNCRVPDSTKSSKIACLCTVMLYRRNSVFYNLRISSILTRYDLGIMYYLSKIFLRNLPWVPWSPRCSKNLVRSFLDSHDASKKVNPGNHSYPNLLRMLT